MKYNIFAILFIYTLACSWQAPALAANTDIPSAIKHTSSTALSSVQDKITIQEQRQRDFTQKLLQGAREEVARHPWYKSAYHAGGFPPENEGVCTDLIWRAFKVAGYNFKGMIDKDIKNNRSSYPQIKKADPNIDFRRVPTQVIFFKRHAKTLFIRNKSSSYTVYKKPDNSEIWQPGDLVVFTNPNHIAILSDKRNAYGVPYLLHNQGPIATEGDDFLAWYKKGFVAHFRFIP